MKELKFYRCALCGNLFVVLNDSGQNPICCGQEMNLLAPNTSDGAGEKHVPVLVRNGKNLTVKVGEVPHPMLEEHYIQWVIVLQGDKFQTAALKPGEAPEATFTLDSDSEPVTAYEYCNLHGLWSAKG
ncbi:MAG: desulfoferrodoxin [Oscillospiraceae bacterium]